MLAPHRWQQSHRISRGPVIRVGGRWSDATSAGGRERGGQTVPEQAADIGHRRPGERTGFLEAEVVELHPGHLAVPSSR